MSESRRHDQPQVLINVWGGGRPPGPPIAGSATTTTTTRPLLYDNAIGLMSLTDVSFNKMRYKTIITFYLLTCRFIRAIIERVRHHGYHDLPSNARAGDKPLHHQPEYDRRHRRHFPLPHHPPTGNDILLTCKIISVSLIVK